jgi:hypothetical protein
MAAELIAGLGAIKTAFDLAKGLKDIDDATRRNGAIIELQEKILTAQAAQSELVEAVGQLKARVAELEAWEAEKERYELDQITTGFFCYRLKPTMGAGEPIHRLCADCYAAGKKKFLQQQISGPSLDRFACGGCGQTIDVHKGASSNSSPYEDYDPYARR